MSNFKVTASQYFINISARHFDTREEAEAVAGQFPKSLLMSVRACGYAYGSTAPNGSMKDYQIDMQVNLQSRKGNEVNEGGIKRYRRFIALAMKNGHAVNFETPNHLWLTEAELEARIAL